MMKPGALSLLTALGLLCQLAGAQTQQAEQQQQQQQQQQEQQDPTAPPKPPRIPGQANTQEEFDAYQAIVNAADGAQKVSLAEQFFVSYPDSGLSSHVHLALAQHYDAAGDTLKFVEHADKTLRDLPEEPYILARLAFIGAEQGQTGETALGRAQQALQVLETMDPPSGAQPENWVSQRMRLQAEAYYASGRIYLNRFTAAQLPVEERPASPDLKMAITNFQQALERDPRHDYAYFRLGFCETFANNAAGAMDAYAGAVATGGVAAGPAQAKVQELHAFVRENMQESELASKTVEEILADASAALQERVAANAQEQARLAEEIRAKTLTAPPAVTPPPTTPPPPLD